MTTQVINIAPDTWTALPVEDYFTVQNICTNRVQIVASATEPSSGTIGHWVDQGQTAGSLDSIAHWVYSTQGATLAFTADSR